MTAWRSMLVRVLIAAASCNPKVTSQVGVQVTQPLLRVRADGTREVPFLGAEVRIECPNDTVETLGSTDAGGWVLVTTRAPVALECQLAIDSAGHPLARIPVDESCTQREGGECRALILRMMLDRRAEVSGGQPIARARPAG